MKATLAMLLMVSVGLLRAAAQSDYAAAHIPHALRSHADAVVRHEEIVVDMLSPTKVRYRVDRAITVLNRAGEERARLVIHYDKATSIKQISGMVYDEMGFQLRKFTKRDCRDESAVNGFSLYEDSRVKHFLPVVAGYPYTVAYSYEVERKQNLIIPAWRPDAYWDVAVQHSQYTFICAEEDEVRVIVTNYSGEPVHHVDDGRHATTWAADNLPARRYEPYSPDPETYKTIVRVAPVNFDYYKHDGQYTNWEELGGWMFDALLSDGMELPAQTVAEVNALVDGLANDKEKAAVLYGYLQRKTRYVSVQIGIGGFKPTAAAVVDRLGYGDCKGLVNYMRALLAVVDIPSYYCVVEAGNAKRDIRADFASMDQGNHVILCVPLEQDTVWLECTSQRLPFGFLGSFTDDRTVWACTPEGGKLLHTPTYAALASMQKRDADLQLAEDGTVSGHMQTTFSGGQYDNHLEIAESSGSEQMKLLKAAYDVDHIGFSNVDYQKSMDDAPTLIENLDVTMPRYAPSNGTQTFLTPNIFNRQFSIPFLSDRKQAVYVNRGYVDEDHLTYTLPTGYAVVSGPWEITLDSPFGCYALTMEQVGNQLSYQRRLVLYGGTYPADQYAELCRFINEVSAFDRHKVVLSKE
ncbi:DUF3857 domain-containing protein [Parapedobacter sp. 10938]|uniref:DUF3857 domain-containing protein n=1 Tax=Parapedobacter flavus TaxID=3110225 RepID=UPI002DBF63C0|nr:DUF3857 domain-containing protein [Parapedobacter sp. 10938]MEC3879067.1 DUF3857 domain-containing protein [Parapedobacter sp. 10938]